MTLEIQKKPNKERREIETHTFVKQTYESENPMLTSPKVEANLQQNIIDVSCIVPTFGRPQGLVKALKSLVSQDTTLRFDIIVVDNHPDATARDVVAEFKQTHWVTEIKYLHEPNPGVANARNAALKLARGRYLAFLDDDQYASKNWLENMISTSISLNAGLIFCPTHARSDLSVDHKNAYLDFFSRTSSYSETQIIDTFFGCGNSVIDLHKCELPDPPFCPTTNETGGEDDKLFTKILNNGVRAAWSHGTFAEEDVDPHRMTKSYIRKRSFAFGQGPSRLCADGENKNVLGLLRWTAIGTAQMVVYAPLYVMSNLIGSSKSIWYMRKMVEGAGKVFWFQAFRPKLYGNAWLKMTK